MDNSLYICALVEEMLKTIFKNLVVFVLSGLMLIAGNGYALNKMECSKSGKLKISFALADNCCAEKSFGKCLLSTKCCKNTSTFFKTSAYSSLKLTHLYPVVTNNINNFNNIFLKNNLYLNYFFSGIAIKFIPPPPSILHCLLLI